MARTAVAKAKSNLPANIDAELAAEVAALSSRLSAPSGDRISCTLNKTFKLPDGQESSDPLRVIIVDFVSYNTYYTERYDPNNIVPPACFALGLEPTGLIPSANSPDCQAESCATCWANQWGSNGKGKACDNTKLLAVLPAIEDLNDETPMWVIKVSKTATKGFDGYVASVARAFQKPIRAVSTLIDFDQNSDYSKLVFGSPEPITQEQFMVAHSRRQEAMQRLMTEPDVSSFQAAAKPAPAKGRAPAAARGRK
jgi:hypothetical protein